MVDNGDDGEPAGTSPAEEVMTTFSRHHFGSSEDTADGFSVTIIENMKEEYGLFVWPCSIILAEYVWQQKSRFTSASVVELGAGTSLPGLVAAKVGADVTLTDDSNRSEVLTHMRRQCDLNNIKCKIHGLTWGVWGTQTFCLCPNIILGADVLYDSCGSAKDSFLVYLAHSECVKLLDGFSFMPSYKTSSLSGNIQLAEIVLDTANGDEKKLM
ncbi:hypothetical protein KY290_013729 [Solanum tuberosum]|uniref:Methyltransferase-like protein 23 n=1 Tax=Solanum tuberosum TaxID=4113 RepID=A0ABQ7VMT3_SOLTU|nr:hypothetical protein KY289_013844 [Solanum tuberosum]KAH0769748.1 hypothetical protein KY290_013729 [Solanum tuberosum]